MPTVLCKHDQSEYYSPITFGAVCAAPNASNMVEFVDNFYNEIIDDIYPIGAHYFSTTSDNPSNLFGRGTWELVEEGKTFLGVGSNFISLTGWTTKTTADGAKWARIFYHTPSGTFTSTNILDNNDANAWSKLGQMKHFYSEAGELELLLEATQLGEKARWRQIGNPVEMMTDASTVLKGGRYTHTDPTNASNASVETGLYVPSTWSKFTCLTKVDKDNFTYITGDHTASWYAIGQYSMYTATNGVSGIAMMPGYSEGTGLSLWARYDNAIGSEFALGETGGSETVTLDDPGWIPSHWHSIGRRASSGGTALNDVGRGSTACTVYTAPTGGNAPHNNLQPYTKIFVWKRVS